MSMQGKHILMMIGGSIAAYKALDVIRLLRRQGAHVQTVLTQGGCEFVTPLSVSALSENPAYTDLFSLKDESEMGHIRLSREADAIVILPASADFMAKMAHGLADDLASTVLLATDYTKTPTILVPAMNPHMWQHPTTRRNLLQCEQDGVHIIEPDSGEMACGEIGQGRLPEPDDIIAALGKIITPSTGLKGKKVVITGGSTQEAIDPVRYIANHSSGKQALAIAEICAQHGADVTLIHGAIHQAIAPAIRAIPITSADSMQQAVEVSLPADIVICASAVADWCMETVSDQKLKKVAGKDQLTLTLKKTPDILKNISQHVTQRPALVVGFAAETENLLENAKSKLERKGCDWILANSVACGAVFGKDNTHIHLLTKDGITEWGACSKHQAARHLVEAMITFFNPDDSV